MTLQKQYQFKGLNLRQSDILIPPEFASYASNCDLNYSGELRKRNGFELSATAGLPIIHMMVYYQANELLIMCSDGLYKKTGTTFTKIPMSITGTVPTWTGDCTSIELNGTLYISDTTGILPVFKYDGIVFTQAGNRKPIVKELTGLIQPPYSEADDFFGYRTAYIPPYLGQSATNREGYLLSLDKKPTGQIWTFLISDFGYEPVASVFDALTYVAGISIVDFTGIGRGDRLAILRAVPNIVTNDYDLSVLIYDRTVSDLNYTLTTTINVTSSFNVAIFSSFNFFMDNAFGEAFVISAYTPMVRKDSPIISYYFNGTAWIQQANIVAPQANSAFGYSIDLITFFTTDTENILIVGAPYFTSGAFTPGIAYIYRKLGAAPWTLAYTLASPNTTTAGQWIFGSCVNLIRFQSNLNSYGVAFVTYRLPTGNPQLAVYNHTTPNTWPTTPSYYITIPGNEQVNEFGYRVELLNNALAISSPLSGSSSLNATYGKVFIYRYEQVYPGSPQPTLIQTLESPDTSYDNDANSKIKISQSGFGGWITPSGTVGNGDFYPYKESVVISYPAFNILGINHVGRVFSYTENKSSVGVYDLDLGTSTENQKYMRIYTTYVDANGNIINSEAVTFTFNGTSAKLTLETFRNTWYNDRYFLGNIATATPLKITNATATYTITTISHNLIAGDKILVKTYTTDPANLNTTYPHEFQLLTVVSVTANSVTLNTSELVKDTYITNRLNYKGVTTNAPLNGSNTYWNIFVSDDEFFGYQLVASLDAQDIITDEATTITIEIDDIVIAEDVDIFLNDIYDDTVLKKEIPHIRYLGTYQNLLLGANIKYEDEQDKAEFRNRFIWSDASIGGSVETFAPFDYEVIGENIAKELTAVIGTQDNIHVFKNRKSYAISGILIGGQYRVRELISEETGCVNHNSMIATRGQVLFMSEAGLYSVAGGGNPNELSDANQPLFMAPNIDLYRSISTFDGKLEKVYTFLKNTVDPTKNLLIVWNYYFNQWYLYEGMGLTGPMVVYNDRLNIADGIYLKEMRDNVFTDIVMPAATTKPVYFKYYTGWFHMGLPSIRKKFVNLVLFSILRLRDYAAIPFEVPRAASEPPDFSLDIKTQLDWIATDWDNFNVPFATDKRVDDHKLTQTQCKSIRYLIENNRNEPILLTGYEFEWESTQDKPKGLT